MIKYYKDYDLNKKIAFKLGGGGMVRLTNKNTGEIYNLNNCDWVCDIKTLFLVKLNINALLKLEKKRLKNVKYFIDLDDNDEITNKEISKYYFEKFLKGGKNEK